MNENKEAPPAPPAAAPAQPPVNVQEVAGNFNKALSNIRQVMEAASLPYKEHAQLQRDLEYIESGLGHHCNMLFQQQQPQQQTIDLPPELQAQLKKAVEEATARGVIKSAPPQLEAVPPLTPADAPTEAPTEAPTGEVKA